MIFALDASVVLAVIFDEPGGEEAVDLMSEGIMSSINYCEVMTRCLGHGADGAVVEHQLARLGIAIVPFSITEARLAADLRKPTRHHGLSLGDRACLALAQHRGIAALTADRQWHGLELGVDIRLIR